MHGDLLVFYREPITHLSWLVIQRNLVGQTKTKTKCKSFGIQLMNVVSGLNFQANLVGQLLLV